MYERLEQRLWVKDAQRARVCEVGVARAKDCDVVASRLDIFADVDCRGARRLHTRRVARVREEGDLARVGLVESGGPSHLDIGKLFFDARARQTRKLFEFHAESYRTKEVQSSKLKVIVVCNRARLRSGQNRLR